MPATKYFKVEDSKTGKSYRMPWKAWTEPTEQDISEFVYREENRDITTDIADFAGGNLWEGPSRAAESFSNWIRDPRRGSPNEFPANPYIRGAIGGAAEGIGDFASGLTNPINLGLTALTFGQGTAAKMGHQSLAAGLGSINKAAAGTMAAHGGYRAASADTPEEFASGAGEFALSMLPFMKRPGPVASQALVGPRNRPAPQTPYNPNIRQIPVQQRGLPGEIIDVTPQGPTFSPELPSGPGNRGLPPASRTFYGGPTGGAVSTNPTEPATRVFSGGSGMGNKQTFTRGRSTPIVTPPPPMTETSIPGANQRDVLPQNSPYGAIMRQGPAPIEPPTPPVPFRPAPPAALPDMPPLAPEPPPPIEASPPPPMSDISAPPIEPPQPLNPWVGTSDKAVHAAAKVGDKGALTEAQRRNIDLTKPVDFKPPSEARSFGETAAPIKFRKITVDNVAEEMIKVDPAYKDTINTIIKNMETGGITRAQAADLLVDEINRNANLKSSFQKIFGKEILNKTKKAEPPVPTSDPLELEASQLRQDFNDARMNGDIPETLTFEKFKEAFPAGRRKKSPLKDLKGEEGVIGNVLYSRKLSKWRREMVRLGYKDPEVANAISKSKAKGIDPTKAGDLAELEEMGVELETPSKEAQLIGSEPLEAIEAQQRKSYEYYRKTGMIPQAKNSLLEAEMTAAKIRRGIRGKYSQRTNDELIEESGAAARSKDFGVFEPDPEVKAEMEFEARTAKKGKFLETFKDETGAVGKVDKVKELRRQRAEARKKGLPPPDSFDAGNIPHQPVTKKPEFTHEGFLGAMRRILKDEKGSITIPPGVVQKGRELREVYDDLFTSGLTVIRNMGGKNLERLIQKNRLDADQFSAYINKQIEKFTSKLSKGEFENYTDVVQFGARPMNQSVKDAVNQFHKLDLHLTKLEAQVGSRVPSYQHTQYQSIHERSKKIMQAVDFGSRDLQDPASPISQMVDQLGDPDKAREIIARYLGQEKATPKAWKNFSDAVTTAEAFTKLSKFIINNTANLAMIPLRAGFRNTGKGVLEVAKDYRNAIDQIKSSGAWEPIRSELIRESSKASKAYGIQFGEEINRGLSALAGKARARDLYSRLQKDPNNKRARMQLEDLILEDANTLLGQGSLTDKQINRAGGRMSEITQGRASTIDLPHKWTGDPLIKLALLYKRYAFTQSKNMKNAVLENPGRTIPVVLGLFGLAGEAIGDVNALLRAAGRTSVKRATEEDTTYKEEAKKAIGERGDIPSIESAREWLDEPFNGEKFNKVFGRWINNLSQAWALGYLGDLMSSATTSKGGLSANVAGPIIGDIGETTWNLSRQDRLKNLGAQGLRAVPFIGLGLSDAYKDYMTDKAPLSRPRRPSRNRYTDN